VSGAVFAALTSFASVPGFAQSPQPAIQNASVKPIGKVVSASGTATIEHVNPVIVQASLGNRTGGAKVSDPVYLGDIVQTGADGRLGITFADGTAFNVSSNARMELNEFVYDPNSKSNSTVFNLTKGAFTFVAGNVAKTGDMRVETPVATMGIRGTTPHIEILRDGSVKFSTLFEEGKDQAIQKYGGPPSPAAPSPTKPREKLNLNICRGC
jgi:hypothetical protein